jgi:cardiolipin synthase
VRRAAWPASVAAGKQAKAAWPMEWSAIGSMNFDNRSMALNDESTLMVLDGAFGAQMMRLFLDDLQHAREITPAEFSRRPWRSRLVERAAKLLTRIL